MTGLTAEQIDALAKKREPLPDSAGLAARKLYHCLALLYREYRDGITDARAARIEKGKLCAAYRNESLWESVFEEQNRRTLEISRAMVRANRDGCPICKEIARIWDGRKE